MIRYWEEDTETVIYRPFDLEKHDKEMYNKWLDKVIKAREEIKGLTRFFDNALYSDNCDSMFKCNEVLRILDKLIGSEVQVISLERVKQAREKIFDRMYKYYGSGNEITQAYCDGFKDSLKILDKLLESEEE